MCQICTNASEVTGFFDWNTIAAVASAIAAIAALVVSVVVACTQSARDKRAQKISVFDKRYQIYCSFLKIYKYSGHVKQDSQDIDWKTNILNYIAILDMVTHDYDFLEGKSYRGLHNQLLNTINNSGGEERHTADLQLYYLDMRIQSKLDHLKTILLSEIQMAEFCFDNKICDALKRYVDELYKYIGVFSEGSSQETVRDASGVLSSIENIEKEKIIDSMRAYLSYSRIK